MGIIEDVIADLNSSIDSSIAALKSELGKLRTGRASVSILDGIKVDYYGTPTPLNQVAALQVADARLITIKPWERNLINDIEKAIRNSGLGINPQNDGDIIRLPIPPLNEERRRDLVKRAKSQGEETRIGMRNHRRDANDMLKELEKDKQISEDDLKKALEKVQTEVDRGVKSVDDVLAVKEKEIVDI
ncbi:MAG: ribosome recycling factor [Clostridia bacterium]|nr:ribosome recycling factor [Deltaproteobacteria bacterium]